MKEEELCSGCASVLTKRRNHAWEYYCKNCGRKWLMHYRTQTWAGGQTTGETTWEEVKEWPVGGDYD